MLTSLLFTAVHQSLLFKNEEELVALLAYSSFLQVATSSLRIIACELVVVVVYA